MNCGGPSNSAMRLLVKSNPVDCRHRTQEFEIGRQLRRSLSGQGSEIMDHVGLIAISKLVRDGRPSPGRDRSPVDRSLEPEDARVDLWTDTQVGCKSPFELPQAESHAIRERRYTKATLPRNHRSHRRLKPRSRVQARNEPAKEPISSLHPPSERARFCQFRM